METFSESVTFYGPHENLPLVSYYSEIKLLERVRRVLMVWKNHFGTNENVEVYLEELGKFLALKPLSIEDIKRDYCLFGGDWVRRGPSKKETVFVDICHVRRFREEETWGKEGDEISNYPADLMEIILDQSVIDYDEALTEGIRQTALLIGQDNVVEPEVPEIRERIESENDYFWDEEEVANEKKFGNLVRSDTKNGRLPLYQGGYEHFIYAEALELMTIILCKAEENFISILNIREKVRANHVWIELGNFFDLAKKFYEESHGNITSVRKALRWRKRNYGLLYEKGLRLSCGYSL